MAYKKIRKHPNSISKPYWETMLNKWETYATSKKLSEQNSKNKNLDCDGLSSPLHIGGSIPISKHKWKHVNKTSPFGCVLLILLPQNSMVF